MNLVFDNSISKVFSVVDSFTDSLFIFIESIINFITTPIYELISDFTYNDLPLGSFFGAPLRLVAKWVFPNDVTIVGFVFGVGIAIYLVWNIAVWISNIIN